MKSIYIYILYIFMTANTNINLNIKFGDSLSKAIDTKLDSDLNTDVKLGLTEWQSIFDLIKKDQVAENRNQFNSKDTDIKNGKHYVVQEGSYQIKQCVWNQILNIAKTKMNIVDNTQKESESKVSTAATEVVNQQENSQNKTELTHEKFKELVNKCLNQQVDSAVVDKVIEKFNKVVKYNQENNIPILDKEGNLVEELETRIINYAKALKFNSKESEFEDTFAKDLSTMQEQLKEAGITKDSLAESLNNGEISEEEYNEYIEILNYKPQDTTNLKIENINIKTAVENGDMEGFKNAIHQSAKEYIELFDDEKGDGKISIEELLAHEMNDLDKTLSEEEKNNLKIQAANFIAMINQDNDSTLDENEISAYLWAMSKINDSGNKKSAHDITYEEWKFAQESIANLGFNKMN